MYHFLKNDYVMYCLSFTLFQTRCFHLYKCSTFIYIVNGFQWCLQLWSNISNLWSNQTSFFCIWFSLFPEKMIKQSHNCFDHIHWHIIYWLRVILWLLMTGERRLDNCTNMISVCQVNPNAKYVIRCQPEWQYLNLCHCLSVCDTLYSYTRFAVNCVNVMFYVVFLSLNYVVSLCFKRTCCFKTVWCLVFSLISVSHIDLHFSCGRCQLPSTSWRTYLIIPVTIFHDNIRFFCSQPLRLFCDDTWRLQWWCWYRHLASS